MDRLIKGLRNEHARKLRWFLAGVAIMAGVGMEQLYANGGATFAGITIGVNGLAVNAGGSTFGSGLTDKGTGSVNAQTFYANNTPVVINPTPAPTDTPIPPVATATPIPAVATATPEIAAALTRSTPEANTILYFPGAQGTPGVYITRVPTATIVPTATPGSGCTGFPCGTGNTSSTAALSGDVSLGSANTFGDASSVSLTTGTWFISAHAIVADSGGPSSVTMKAWNGTTAYCSDQSATASTRSMGLNCSTVQTFGSTTTVKISVAADSTTTTIKATPPNNATGLTNTGTIISAVKLAS